MVQSFTIAELALTVGGTARGDSAVGIAGVNSVPEAGPDQATWVSNPKYASQLNTSRAGVVLVPEQFGPTPMPAILCPHIERSVAALLGAFASAPAGPAPGVHPSAVVSGSAQIGPAACIGPHVVIEDGARVGARSAVHAGVFIGRDTRIGDDCRIWPNVVIRERCILGNRVEIHPCAVIGADGFGFFFEEGRHHKVPHIGGVLIEDDVEIGAGTCIDRAKFGHTVIGLGSKFDNQVQIAHNARIGAHCLFVAHSGLAGSTRVGDYAVFAARGAALDNLHIGERATVAAQSVTAKDVPAGATVSGFPARDHREELRERAMTRRLPELMAKLKELAARVELLEQSTDHRA